MGKVRSERNASAMSSDNRTSQTALRTFENGIVGTRETAQWFRAHSALPKDPGSIPRSRRRQYL